MMKQSRRSLLLGSLAGVGAILCGSVLSTRAMAQAAAQAEMHTKTQAKPRVIKIQAKKFVYTPNEITIKKGDQVVLELTALDFVHGFNLPDFHIRADIPPGKVTTVILNPTEEGRFTFLCDNFCGDGHEEMHGTIIVEG